MTNAKKLLMEGFNITDKESKNIVNEAIRIVKKETLDEVDKKIIELENKRNHPKQNPDKIKLIEIKNISYYPAKKIDEIDSELWLEWRKWIEGKKEEL